MNAPTRIPTFGQKTLSTTNLLFRWTPTTGADTRGPRDFLLSRMLTVVVAVLPRLAFDALLSVTLNDSVDSFALSSAIEILKLFAVSPGANVNVPEAAV